MLPSYREQALVVDYDVGLADRPAEDTTIWVHNQRRRDRLRSFNQLCGLDDRGLGLVSGHRDGSRLDIPERLQLDSVIKMQSFVFRIPSDLK